MEKIKCIVIVGKPGAGKSTIAGLLSKHLPADYTSLGSFMRDVIGIPDPHIGVDKNPVYDKLHNHVLQTSESPYLILDCHPYPQEDLLALENFLLKEQIELMAVVQVIADDKIALSRLERRPRPGQSYEERLKYFNDNQIYIDRFSENRNVVLIENNKDLSEEKIFDEIVFPILTRLTGNT